VRLPQADSHHMTDPEGSAAPAGWVIDHNGLAHPDPQASSNRDRLDRRAAQIASRLETHAELAAAVQGLEDRFAEAIQALLNTPGPPGEQALALIADLNPAVEAVASTTGPADVLPIDRYRFILRRLHPGLADDHPLMRMQPAQLVANVSDEPRAIRLDPGEIAMVFASASAEDRAAYDSLIRAMQDALGYSVGIGKGGRPARVDRGEEREKTDPRVVARLRGQGRDPEDIARILAAVYPGEGWAEAGEDGTVYARSDGLRRRINRYADDGDLLLAEQSGVSRGF
jgi:hypothetical protein